ncbi:hypothetical protein TNCV_3607911, partial [Trichonephila clavipes]
MQGKLFCVSGWPEGGLRRCVPGRSPLAVRGHFLWLKNFMQGKAILRVRMAERSKALRSGRSPLLWAWKAILRVRIAEWSKALRSGRSPLLWAW